MPNNGKAVIIEEGQEGGVDVLWLGLSCIKSLLIVAVGGGGYLNGGGGGSGYVDYWQSITFQSSFYQYMAYPGLMAINFF